MTTRDPGSLTVLLSTGRPQGTATFVEQLVGGRRAGVEYEYFSWRTALFGSFDVFHVHWPELLIRDSRSTVRAFVKRRRAELLLARLRRRGVPIVRTFHNPRPHEQGRPGEERILDEIDRRTALFIALNEHTRPEAGAECVVIPHGHYVPSFAHHPWPDAVPGRLAYIGIIRPYKNVEALLDAFRALEDPDATLHVAGDPHRGQAAAIRAAAGGDPRIALTLRYLDDAELVREVREASLIVLPYREMRNSGALLVALSLRRPALVPASDVNRLLADEFGHQWVRQYEGELDAATLAAHSRDVAESGLLDGPPPDLSRRDWDVIGLAHEQAYRRATAGARHPSSALSPGGEFRVTNGAAHDARP